MSEFLDYLNSLMKKYPGRSAGALTGFVFAVILLTVGLKKTFLIILITLLGFIVGNLIDSGFRLPGLEGLLKKKKKNNDDIDLE